MSADISSTTTYALNKSGVGTLSSQCADFSESTEADLLRRAKGGDTAAFDEIITRYRQRIFMTAYLIIRNEDDALDLCQEAFLRAWKALRRFDGRQALGAWLRRIVTNAAIDLCRSRRRRPLECLEEMDSPQEGLAARSLAAPAEQPGDALERSELRARIEAAFSELSPDHRAVIVLREIEDLSYEDIAQTTGVSTGTVMSRLFHARKKLQHLLADMRHG